MENFSHPNPAFPRRRQSVLHMMKVFLKHELWHWNIFPGQNSLLELCTFGKYFQKEELRAGEYCITAPHPTLSITVKHPRENHGGGLEAMVVDSLVSGCSGFLHPLVLSSPLATSMFCPIFEVCFPKDIQPLELGPSSASLALIISGCLV